MNSENKYWKGIEELHEAPEFIENRDKEFTNEIPVDEFLSDSKLDETSHSRRDFLKFLGFSVAAATLAACEAPVIKSVPYVNKPEDVVPGIANWYASAYYDGNSFANVLVKTREARPIFIKGNKYHGITKASTNPRIVASVLSLYDSARLKNPTVGGKDSDWATVDAEISSRLQAISDKGGKIAIVSNTIISPTAQMAMLDFKNKYGKASGMIMEEPAVNPADVADNADPVAAVAMDTLVADTLGAEAPAVEEPAPVMSGNGNATIDHIQYDAVSFNGIRKANEACFGEAVIPDYDFSKAKTIVSIGADFLNGWLNSNEYAAQYASRRNPDLAKREGSWMSRHYQFEANMSTSGSAADIRKPVKPSQYGVIAAGILAELGGDAGGIDYSDYKEGLAKVAEDLKKSGKESLVVCGSNDKGIQIIVNAINEKLGVYGTTINLANPLNMFAGDDEKMDAFVSNPSSYDAVLFVDCNPVYNHNKGAQLAEALESVSTTISFAGYADETASRCEFVCPTHNYLEAWNDYNPKMNHYALAQPAIRPLFDTRHWAESMMVWAGVAKHEGKDSTAYYEKMKALWIQYGYPDAKDYYKSEEDYWNWMIHDGSGDTKLEVSAAPSMKSGALAEGLKSAKEKASSASGTEIAFYQKPSMGDGQLANNPWLQEMPDPITTVTWDNYATMSPEDMGSSYNLYLGQKDPATIAEIKVGDKTLKLPVVPQPGQAAGTIGIAVGYGRGEMLSGDDAKLKIGKGAYSTGDYGDYDRDENGDIKPIGGNAFSLMSLAAGTITSDVSAEVSATSETHPMAVTQSHHTVMGRNSIIKETSLDFYVNGWKETNYGSPKNRPGFNPQQTLPVHEDVGGGTDAEGKLIFDKDGNPVPDGRIDANDRKHVSAFDLWNEHPVEKVGHRWGMTIDLSSCFGCGSCIVACQAENNVPVVGKDEVRRVRIMHWLRLDRYYSSDQEDFVGDRKDEWSYKAMEVPESNPKVVFQPVMCQHCNHAPCETVCPVVATTHSNEGLNQMTYNRCIGTRYCANNCPYKVRRFNWFNYPSYKKFTAINPAQDDIGRMVLNPDVTVRTRGVMEKCSLCVQQIQNGKLQAKKEDRPVKDGDIETACQGACPANAIIFGDLNDMEEVYTEEMSGKTVEKEGSAVYRSARSDRSYQMLEEVGTKPNIFYKVKVRNIEDPYGAESMEYIPAKGWDEEHDGGH